MARHDTLSRLDAVLVDRGLVPTRAQAQAAVLAGEVYVDGAPVTKAGARVAPDALIELRTRRPSFVSRGGLKLDHALTAFGLDVGGLRAVDVGSSTGGFTDCLLKRGAAHVHAVDVGTGQLAWELRTDPRVTVLERRDVRGVTPEELGGAVDLAVVDVAFIGLGKIMPVLRALVRSGGTVVALVKPQFEAGPRAAKRGVVRDAAVHEDVLRRVKSQAEASGLRLLTAVHSPLAGPEGNIEFFFHLEADPGPAVSVDIAGIVRTAHERVPRRGVRLAAGPTR